MCEAGPHWMLSSDAGAVLAWQWRPVCSLSWDVPDTRLRRWFHAKMDRTFDPPHPAAIQNHCLHIHAAYLVGRLLRG